MLRCIYMYIIVASVSASCNPQQLARVKAEVRRREETIKEKQQFLENEIENNAEQEKRISIAERTAARFRSDYQDAETQRVQFHDEVI